MTSNLIKISLLFLLTIFQASCINTDQYGPNIEDKKQYFGCYFISENSYLYIDERYLKFSGEYRRILRYLYIKTDPNIFLDGQIFVDKDSNIIRLGRKDRRQFIPFQKNGRSIRMELSDGVSGVHFLEKAPCPSGGNA